MPVPRLLLLWRALAPGLPLPPSRHFGPQPEWHLRLHLPAIVHALQPGFFILLSSIGNDLIRLPSFCPLSPASKCQLFGILSCSPLPPILCASHSRYSMNTCEQGSMIMKVRKPGLLSFLVPPAQTFHVTLGSACPAWDSVSSSVPQL